MRPSFCTFILTVDRCQAMFIIGTVHVYFVFNWNSSAANTQVDSVLRVWYLDNVPVQTLESTERDYDNLLVVIRCIMSLLIPGFNWTVYNSLTCYRSDAVFRQPHRNANGLLERFE